VPTICSLEPACTWDDLPAEFVGTFRYQPSIHPDEWPVVIETAPLKLHHPVKTEPPTGDGTMRRERAQAARWAARHRDQE